MLVFTVFQVDESGPVYMIFFPFTMISYGSFENLMVHLFITYLILLFFI